MMATVTRTSTFRLALPLLLAVGAAAINGRAQDRMEPLPPELQNVGIDEHLNGQLPLDAEFTDHTGKKVKLRDYFDGHKPVILTLNYYKCPMLCGLTLNGMVDGLKDLDWVAGDEFRIVTVSFDPLETSQLALLKRQNYLTAYGKPAAAQGWTFLTGRRGSIDPLLKSTGFRIAWNEERQEWMHVAALLICTPDGRISRYLYGVLFEPKTLRLSLVEASEGKIGTTMDQLLLFCYHYDGKGYSLAGMRVVQAGGGVTLLAVGLLLAVLWRRERRRATATPAPPTPPAASV
jgi:protein SCO1/2